MNRRLSVLLSLSALLASACDPSAPSEPEASQESDVPVAAELDDEQSDAPEAEPAFACHTAVGEAGALPTPPRGMTEPRYRIDESEGLAPEALVAPEPTEAELAAARTYSQRFVADDGTLGTYASAK